MAGFLDALKAAQAPSAPPSGGFLAALATAPPPAAMAKGKSAPSLLSRVDAVGAGFNRGVADIVGLPMDTAVNVMNLGKSGIEAAMLAAGKTPPTWLDPTQRSQLKNVWLSSPWIANKMQQSGLAATQNPNPNDTASGLLYGAGRFGAGAILPGEGADAKIAQAGQRDLAGIAKEMPGMRAMQGGLTRGQQAAAAGREALLTPGERSGSTPLRQLEAKLSSHPWTSGPFAKLAARRQQSINEAASGAIGEPAETLDSTTLGNAAERIGDVFGAIRNSGQQLPVEPAKTEDFLNGLDEDTRGLLPNDASIRQHPLVRTLQGLMDRASGKESNLDAFMRDYQKMAPEGDLNGTRTWVEPDETDPTAAHIEFIGRGEKAPFALRKLLALADQHGVPLTANASAVGDKGISTETLSQHYTRAGFRPDAAFGEGFLRRNPQVTAKQLGQLSSKLGKAAYKQMTGQNGDRDLGQALNAVKGHVDDLLEQHLTGEGKTAYSKARREYRALMQLTSRQNVVNPSTGDVNGVALANYLQKSDRPGFLYGRNTSPLYQAARFAQAFKPVVGNSGTATRQMENFRSIEDFLMGIPANWAARAYLSRPGGMLAQGAVRGAQGAVGLVPRGIQGLLTNPVVAGGLARPR